LSPASMAGDPTKGIQVFVGPPLSASPSNLLWTSLMSLAINQGPRIKLALIFLGGIDRDKGPANDVLDIRRFQEGIHGTVVVAYPSLHHQVLRPLARSTPSADADRSPAHQPGGHGPVRRHRRGRYLGGDRPLRPHAA